MAAVEARAAWQRTANRCFVQEDAKRAPQLACCSTCSTSSKQVDDVAAPTGVPDESARSVVGFASLSGIPSNSTLSSDARWWLLLQPNFEYQKGLPHELLNASDANAEIMRTNLLDSASRSHGSFKEDDSKLGTTACLKKDPKVRKQASAQVVDMKEYYEVMETDLVGCSVSKQTDELCFDSESVWFGSEKSEPWWRAVDRDELASLVVQKSLDHVENCDLPPAQKMNVHGEPFSRFGCLDDDVDVTSTDSTRNQSGGFSNASVRAHDWSTLKGTCGTVERVCTISTSNKPLSSLHKGMSVPESDLNKAQLLEALCHSQTRAREADKELKQAKAEKEHVVKLLLRQASQLFAYKQWFELLQLEASNLHNEKNNNTDPIFALFPLVFSRMPSKAKKLWRNCQKVANRKRGKRGRPGYDIGMYTVTLAFGFTLVGAGLLLGWTVGWMLPSF